MPLVPPMKVAVPQLPPEAVDRPDLRAELMAATEPVVLVCAPAGYGKTMLLADWLRADESARTAFVRLDSDDNDPARLYAAVAAAAGAPVPDADPARRDLPALLAGLLGGGNGPVRLVLDDVHELSDPDVLHPLASLACNRPSGLQLVLAGRFDPPIGLARLRVEGRLYEVRADRLSFGLDETVALLAGAGLDLDLEQAAVLHARAGGWPAGVRLAVLALSESADPAEFLSRFSGDDRTVADYLTAEVLGQLPADDVDVLRDTSVCDPIPTGLAAALTRRPDAGRVLDALSRRTALTTRDDLNGELFSVQPLLRSYLQADLRRSGRHRTEQLHATAARWLAEHDQPIRTLVHARRSEDHGLLAEMVHRFALALILAGDHGVLRRALAALGSEATAADPLLALTSSLTNLEAGELPAARSDLRHARRAWPAADDESTDIRVLRLVVEHLQGASGGASLGHRDGAELPTRPDLEALARLGRATADLAGLHDRENARDELESILGLARRNGFEYLTMQCQSLLGGMAANDGDWQRMRELGNRAVATAHRHGWEDTVWSASATALLAYAALQRAEPVEAERLAEAALSSDRIDAFPQLRHALGAVLGAAQFDRGERIGGLAQMQRARTEFADNQAGIEQLAGTALLECRAALLLGHHVAARTVRGWLAAAATTELGELALMRAWAEAGAGHDRAARGLAARVLDGSVHAVLPSTVVECWLVEADLAIAARERSTARQALRAALAHAEPLDAVRPFAMAGARVRELLVHQHGSFGACNAFAARALAATPPAGPAASTLSGRELTVLALLPSLLSLDEIATDLAVSVNTVKSHVRSIYTKLGVSSRRAAVLAAHEYGLLSGAGQRATG